MIGSIEEMHYYLKEQLKIADNTMYQELLTPQIDFILNVAEDTLIKMIAFPLYNPVPNFQISERVINSINTVLVDAKEIDTNVQSFDKNNVLYKLPINCKYFFNFYSRLFLTHN